jgi:hypothetical protein
VGHIVHSGASGPRNIDALFFILGWARYIFDKNHVGTRYAELVFLHPVGSTRHVVHSVCPCRETSIHYFSCSGGPNAFPIKSAPGHVTSNLHFLHPVESLSYKVHSGASGV